MNLHDIQLDEYPRMLWAVLGAYGGNGHFMGDHIWPIYRVDNLANQPAPMDATNVYEWARWVHQVPYHIQTFGLDRRGRRGPWVVPLCGKRSASRTARTNLGHQPCADCSSEASRLHLQYINADQFSATFETPRYAIWTAERRRFRGY